MRAAGDSAQRARWIPAGIRLPEIRLLSLGMPAMPKKIPTSKPRIGLRQDILNTLKIRPSRRPYLRTPQAISLNTASGPQSTRIRPVCGSSVRQPTPRRGEAASSSAPKSIHTGAHPSDGIHSPKRMPRRGESGGVPQLEEAAPRAPPPGQKLRSFPAVQLRPPPVEISSSVVLPFILPNAADYISAKHSLLPKVANILRVFFRKHASNSSGPASTKAAAQPSPEGVNFQNEKFRANPDAS